MAFGNIRYLEKIRWKGDQMKTWFFYRITLDNDDDYEDDEDEELENEKENDKKKSRKWHLF